METYVLTALSFGVVRRVATEFIPALAFVKLSHVCMTSDPMTRSFTILFSIQSCQSEKYIVWFDQSKGSSLFIRGTTDILRLPVTSKVQH